VDCARIAELLQPFLDPHPEDRAQDSAAAAPGPAILQSISTYIDLLLRWNSRVNLTSIRQPEQIVTRHFGESLFAARHLFPAREASPALRVIDVGSGAGFPGVPIRMWAPAVHLTLVESNHKKATFLREVIRALKLSNVQVFAGRAADLQPRGLSNQPATGVNEPGDVVTLRAVEQFSSVLPAASQLVAPAGRLALLIGRGQVSRARELTPKFIWNPLVQMPLSSDRCLLIGRKEST
jgi:16S rRNA (guanine527-N7)-methyltransferase